MGEIPFFQFYFCLLSLVNTQFFFFCIGAIIQSWDFNAICLDFSLKTPQKHF